MVFRPAKNLMPFSLTVKQNVPAVIPCFVEKKRFFIFPPQVFPGDIV